MKEFDYDMINRYLEGEMNGEEMNAFEEQMQQDAELQNEVALIKDVNETLKIKLHPYSSLHPDNGLSYRNQTPSFYDACFVLIIFINSAVHSDFFLRR